MALRDVVRSRLALRIYLVGLAQFAVVAAGFFAVLVLELPRDHHGPHDGVDHFVANLVGKNLADRPALEQLLEDARVDLRATVTLVDPEGAVYMTNAPSTPPACVPPAPGRPPEGAPHCHAAPIVFPNGKSGRVELLLPGLPPPPFSAKRVIGLVLIVVGISSWLLARTLTRPLRRLSTAARALGGGDLKARAALPNRDELGEVSRAFDEMAERVAELLRAEKELLANVSHELRTPLARIRMALALASEADEDAGVTRESLADIAEDLDELERLISDILMATRLELDDPSPSGGLPPLRRTRVDVRDLLSRAASRFQTAHPDRALRVNVEGEAMTIDADPVLLRRVVDNLLENAHKYTESASEPIQLVARGGESVTIEVIDRGIGIAEEDLPRVFRPFFRTDKSRTRATGGLGLGLALAKRIVEAHGGTIALESRPNQGTRARVNLPLAVDEKEERRPSP